MSFLWLEIRVGALNPQWRSGAGVTCLRKLNLRRAWLHACRVNVELHSPGAEKAQMAMGRAMGPEQPDLRPRNLRDLEFPSETFLEGRGLVGPCQPDHSHRWLELKNNDA